jgi:hypothetical protein
MCVLWLLRFNRSVVHRQRASIRSVYCGYHSNKMHIETSRTLYDLVNTGVHETNPLYKQRRQGKCYFHSLNEV